ncbi:MAG: xanthine dehydrogenase family protein subunit M [Paracoccaceae bacterium]|nr:xanthine dehydrogenase family protein subunit M [Paracoccaceae bacterium]
MPPEYFSPTYLDEALELMASRSLDLVAGGTDFFPARGRAPVTRDILDITRLEGLRGIQFSDDGVVQIGAATTWSDIAKADLPSAFVALQQAANEVGSIQIQNSGTIAGNLCNASPAADGIPPLLTLDAEIEVAGPLGVRRQALCDFLTGVRQTTMTSAELVIALHIKMPPTHTTSAFEKLGARKYMVISIAMTAVIIGLDETGHINYARIAVGACSPVAQRLLSLEADIIGQKISDISVHLSHLAPLSPISDVRASNEFRSEVVKEQIYRALYKAIAHDG